MRVRDGLEIVETFVESCLVLFSSSPFFGRTYIDRPEVSGRYLLRSTEFADVSNADVIITS